MANVTDTVPGPDTVNYDGAALRIVMTFCGAAFFRCRKPVSIYAAGGFAESSRGTDGCEVRTAKLARLSVTRIAIRAHQGRGRQRVWILNGQMNAPVTELRSLRRELQASERIDEGKAARDAGDCLKPTTGGKTYGLIRRIRSFKLYRSRSPIATEK
jgi:hypothetical protein